MPERKLSASELEMFQEERDLLEKTQPPDPPEDAKAVVHELREGFERLLRKSVKITRLGDRTQKKLIRLMHQLEEKNAEIERQKKELSLYNQKLEEASITDPLTGLRNRRFLLNYMEIGQEEILRHFASGGDQADALFALFDIDHFKHINDRYGHAAGDKVLVQFSKLLRETSRKSDVIARWGGEEFLVIMRQVNRDKGTELAEKIRARIEAEPFDIGDQVIRCTASVGFAPYPFFPGDVHAISWEKALDFADQGLYVAKRSSRNAWVGVLPATDGQPPGEDLYNILHQGVENKVVTTVASFPAEAIAWH